MTPKIRIRIGTRGSPLALRQAEQVAAELGRSYPDWNISLVRVRTKGDLFLDASFSQIGGKASSSRRSKRPSWQERLIWQFTA